MDSNMTDETKTLEIGAEARPTTTQLTSKRIKLMIAGGKLLFVIGICVFIWAANQDGGVRDYFAPAMWSMGAVFGGFGLWLAGRLSKWWKHD